MKARVWLPWVLSGLFAMIALKWRRSLLTEPMIATGNKRLAQAMARIMAAAKRSVPRTSP